MNNITLIMNNSCDKQCKYCYENNKGDKILTTNNIDKIINSFNESGYWNKHITFFGGEPTMSLPVIKYTYDKYKDCTFSIITNGYFLKLEKEQYNFMKNFEEISISLEGTKESYNKIRNGNLEEILNKIFNLNWKNITINLSINGLLFNNEKEFVDNIHLMKKYGLGIHLYGIKGDNLFKNNVDYIHFLKNVKELDEEIYNKIILKTDEVSDTPYLCSFDDAFYISPDCKIVKCARLPEEYGLDFSNIQKSEIMFNTNLLNNHKDLWVGCSQCEVNIGECQVSCPALIEECFKNNKIDLLNKLCEKEKIHHKLRTGEVKL